MQQRQSYVYILASGPHGTLYVGVTSDLRRRVWEHRHGPAPGFAKRYGVRRLVYFEVYPDIRDAIAQEKRIKKWNRAWKVRLIEQDNLKWDDLAAEWFEPEVPAEAAPLHGFPPARE